MYVCMYCRYYGYEWAIIAFLRECAAPQYSRRAAGVNDDVMIGMSIGIVERASERASV